MAHQAATAEHCSSVAPATPALHAFPSTQTLEPLIWITRSCTNSTGASA
ncbi:MULTISPECIES: hypothetical protein [unclassified Streptomyces]